MVDVDDAVRVGRAKFVRDDLHVAREDDEVDLLFFEERELLVLHLCDSILRHRAGTTSRRWCSRVDGVVSWFPHWPRPLVSCPS